VFSSSIFPPQARFNSRYGCAYNVFRRKQEPNLYCAVPEDKAVPSFVTQGWEFAAKVTNPSEAPRGFQEHAARAGVRFNGYYVFQAR
jgi:hypothetical protein